MTTELIASAPSDVFDYTALDPETRIVVRQRTSEIRDRLRSVAQGIIEIGERLLEVKARLAHGQFSAWLQAEFEMSEGHARKLMQVARAFGQNDHRDRFAPTALYLLAAPGTPDEAREEALALAAAGEEITPAKARELISEYRPAPTAPTAPTAPQFGASGASLAEVSSQPGQTDTNRVDELIEELEGWEVKIETAIRPIPSEDRTAWADALRRLGERADWLQAFDLGLVAYNLADSLTREAQAEAADKPLSISNLPTFFDYQQEIRQASSAVEISHVRRKIGSDARLSNDNRNLLLSVADDRLSEIARSHDEADGEPLTAYEASVLAAQRPAEPAQQPDEPVHELALPPALADWRWASVGPEYKLRRSDPHETTRTWTTAQGAIDEALERQKYIKKTSKPRTEPSFSDEEIIGMIRARLVEGDVHGAAGYVAGLRDGAAAHAWEREVAHVNAAVMAARGSRDAAHAYVAKYITDPTVKAALLSRYAPTEPSFDLAMGEWSRRATAIGAKLLVYGADYKLIEPNGTTYRHADGNVIAQRILTLESQVASQHWRREGFDGSSVALADVPAPVAADASEDTEPLMIEVCDEYGPTVALRLDEGLDRATGEAIAQIAEALRLLALGQAHAVDTTLLSDLAERQDGLIAGFLNQIIAEVEQ